MQNGMNTNDVKALLRFIVSGCFFNMSDEKLGNPYELNIVCNNVKISNSSNNRIEKDETTKNMTATKDRFKISADKIFKKFQNKSQTKTAMFLLRKKFMPS